jgi:hypothetical protein
MMYVPVSSLEYSVWKVVFCTTAQNSTEYNREVSSDREMSNGAMVSGCQPNRETSVLWAAYVVQYVLQYYNIHLKQP